MFQSARRISDAGFPESCSCVWSSQEFGRVVWIVALRVGDHGFWLEVRRMMCYVERAMMLCREREHNSKTGFMYNMKSNFKNPFEQNIGLTK
jgi:hypothetical protein